MHPYYTSGYGMGAGFGIFGLMWHVVGFLLAVWIVIMILRAFGIGRRGRMMRGMGMWHMHSALGILDERFAKGEIDKTEYEDRKKVLMGEIK